MRSSSVNITEQGSSKGLIRRKLFYWLKGDKALEDQTDFYRYNTSPLLNAMTKELK